VIVEFEVSGPFQKRPGWYRSNVTILRAWWGWFAVALIRGNTADRRRYTWEQQR
jgi:fructoselysine-6-P-deglycase FrlB-like protein